MITWRDYFKLIISRGATPEFATDAVNNLMGLYEAYDWNALVPFYVE